MRHPTSMTLVRAAVALLLVALVLPVLAPRPVAAQATRPPLPSLSASNWILVDVSARRVLASRDPHARVAIASLSKVMTALVALQYAQLGDELSVAAEDLPGEASIGLKPGERWPLEVLLYGLLMRSGNDAAAVIAHGVGDKVARERQLSVDGTSLFVSLMNEKAAALGMANSSFRNPHGLQTSNHYSSAYDLALVTSEALKDARFTAMFGAHSYPFRENVWTNVNRLLYQYDGIVGGKTGVETSSGLCLIEAAERDGRRLLVVVLNAPQWYDDARALLDYGFSFSGGGQGPFGDPSPASGPPAPAFTPKPRGAEVLATPAPPTPTPPPTQAPLRTVATGLASPVPTRASPTSMALPAATAPPTPDAPEPPSPLAIVAVAAIVVSGATLLLARRTRRAPSSAPRARGRPAAAGSAPPLPRTPPEPTTLGQARAADDPVLGERVLDHLALALRHLDAGRTETAESFFVKAIQIAPDFRFSTVPAFWSMPASGYVHLATAFYRCNRPTQARAVLAIGQVRFPDQPRLRDLDQQLARHQASSVHGEPLP